MIMGRNDISTGELLEAMVDGKCEKFNDLDFAMYLKENNLESKELLLLLLEQVNTMIKVTRNGFFMDKYEREFLSYQRKRAEGGPIDPEYLEYLDGLREEETFLEETGKKSLYKAIEERDFFNESHANAVSSAWYDQNIELLKHYWEEAVLGKILEFRYYIEGLLDDKKVIRVKDRDIQEELVFKSKLTNRQMALICFYRGTPINNELKALEIFKEFDNTNTSGRKLYNIYQEIDNDTDRTGADKKKSNSNKIKDFKKVIEYFKSQEKVPDNLLVDYKQLKENIEKQ